MYIQEQPYRALGASPSPICPASTIKSTSFAEYVNLVRCAEMAFPNFNSGQMLSLLRQIYYGDEVWSFDRSPLWRDIIRCGSKISDDPRNILGQALFKSLQASKIVAGTDIGHMLAGWESMLCPTPNVTLRVAPLLSPVVYMPNEEFASWGGDIGSAVAHRVHDQVDLGKSGKDIAWSLYFGGSNTLASDEDLNGDIDSYAIRQGLTGASCSTTRLTPVKSIPAPISQILGDYYSDAITTPLGTARTKRFQCFAQAIGGTLSGRSITNKSTLAGNVKPRIYSFADILYASQKWAPASGMAARSVYLSQYSEEIAKLFLDWLEKRL